MQAASLSALADLIARLERADATLDATLAAAAPQATVLMREAVLPLARAQLALLQANADITLVADELRRYQKYALPGKPSLQIVQLRKQQGAVKQTALIARQNFAQATHAFLRESGLVAPARRLPTDFAGGWLARIAAV